MVAIFVVLMILVLVGVDALVQRYRGQLAPAISGAEPIREPALPAGLFVHQGHAWVELLRSGAVRVGLDEFVRYAMGTPDQVILRRVGEQVRRGEALLTLRRAGHQLVVKAPVSGTIEAANERLATRPETLRGTVYGAAWAYAIRPSRLGEEIAALHVAERASRWLNAEMTRWASWFDTLSPATPGMAMQDGGTPVPGALERMDGEVWSRFQADFLDHPRAS